MSNEIIDTSGFYRVNPSIINELEYAPNFVHGPGYSIDRDSKDTYTYPTDGMWYWFDTKLEAYTFFGLTVPLTEEEKQSAEEALEAAICHAQL